MKNCKSCGKEVSKKAKTCPNCGAKLKKPIFLYIILGFIALMIVGSIISGNEEKARKKEFKQNEIATFKEVDYSVENVERTKGSNEFLKVKDGHEYIIITLKINNKSKEKISFNELDWKIVTSDGAETAFTSLVTEDNDTSLNSGDLNSGGTKIGTVSYEIPEGDKVTLKYYETILSNERAFEFDIED